MSMNESELEQALKHDAAVPIEHRQGSTPDVPMMPVITPAEAERKVGFQSGSARTVEFKSGGTLTIMLSANILKLLPDERALVFGIIDALNKHEDSYDAKAHADAVGGL